MKAAPIVLIVLALSVWRLFDPQTWILVQTVRDLGPLSGWRCANASAYIYDPTREQADSALLADAPEALVLSQMPWLEVDQVEANLRGGDTLVSTHAADQTEDSSVDRRVYVLSPGRLQSISVSVPGGRLSVCNAHLGDWQIVGEQNLG